MYDDGARWKLRKDISIADLLSFVTASIAVIYAYTTLDKRIAMVEAAVIEAKREARRQDDSLLRLQTSIEQKLDRVDQKIDRLMQRTK